MMDAAEITQFNLTIQLILMDQKLFL